MKIATLENQHKDHNTLTWDFPLERTHQGMLLGNGTQGLMIWGTDTLNITVGRAGFWDRRGGRPIGSPITFNRLRELLEANDEPAIKAAFNQHQGEYKGLRSQQIGGGRLELSFPDGLKPESGTINFKTGHLQIRLCSSEGKSSTVVIRQHPTKECAVISCNSKLADQIKITYRSTWEFVGKYLSSIGFQAPLSSRPLPNTFISALNTPADQALAIGYRKEKAEIYISSALGESGEEASQLAQQYLQQASIDQIQIAADEWWTQYNSELPSLKIPDPTLQAIWDYGLYKIACATAPQGIACTLQGPFLEEYQLPPWQCDYHFNINIQMIYWPLLFTGKFDHFQPLWNLLADWMPGMQQTAKEFFEAENAIMLPHAVDDRCQVVGTFWTGAIDHACSAWMALIAWQHYQYSMDLEVLSDSAWPLMTGAFEGYWAMLDHLPEGYECLGPNGEIQTWQLKLPVSVSPEYNGSMMNAWGENASFQLAAMHALTDALILGAQALGEVLDPRWAQIKKELPPYTVVGQTNAFDHPEVAAGSGVTPRDPAIHVHGEEQRRSHRLGLWRGKDLDASHRHHSHLGSVYPFCSIDPFHKEHAKLVKDSIRHLAFMGPGKWSGWCTPWASILLARTDNADGAVTWLRWWFDVFTNIGGGTLHDAESQGCTTLVNDVHIRGLTDQDDNHEIMQIEAGFGAITAISELLLQYRVDTLHVLPKLPKNWRKLEFHDLHTVGGFKVGATVQGGQITEIRVRATHPGTLRLANPWNEAIEIQGSVFSDKIITVTCEKDTCLKFRSNFR